MATPLEISIALHYFCRSGDYGKGLGDNNFSAPAVHDALQRFVLLGLLKKHPGESTEYSATYGLRVYVEQLGRVSFPVQVWQMPEGGSNKTAAITDCPLITP